MSAGGADAATPPAADRGFRRAEILGGLPREPRLGYAMLHVGSAWLQLGAVFAVAAVWPRGPGFGLILVLLMGLSQYRLYFPLHDVCHGSLFRSAWANRLVGRIHAGLLFSGLPAFTHIHLEHHRTWGTREDPGAVDYWVHFRTRGDVLRFLGGPLVGSLVWGRLAANVFQRDMADTTRKADVPKPGFVDLLFLVGGQALVWAAVSGLGSRPWDYLWFWVLPGATVFLFLARLRMYLEHGPADYAVSDYLGENARRIARTHGSNAPAGPFFSYMNFRYHREHHLFPWLPSCHLPEVHVRVRDQLEPDDWSSSYLHTAAQVWKLPGS